MNVAEVKRSGKQLQITAQISVFTCKAASSTCKPLHLPVIFFSCEFMGNLLSMDMLSALE